MYREHQYSRIWRNCAHLGNDLHARNPRHRQVRDDQIWPEALDQRDSIFQAPGFADHDEVRLKLEQCVQSFAQDHVIVDKDQSRACIVNDWCRIVSETCDHPFRRCQVHPPYCVQRRQLHDVR